MSIRLSPRLLAATAILPLLSGCDMIVLDPAGEIARQQGNLIVVSTILMMLIIIPVMALTIFFAWKYRAANKEAAYDPDWDHSTQLELVIWAAPLLIIICLGAITWVGTHLLDPWRALQPPVDASQTLQSAGGASSRPVAVTPVAQAEPLDVQVVALDWKWLFIYPEQGIATVNEFAAPVGRPVRFRISASHVMNSFYIPALAGQIYAMPGMETRLHAVFDRPGDFVGFSANYSGAGFSGMRFGAHSLSDADFAAWVAKVKGDGTSLSRTAYLQLERPSENVPVTHYGSVDPELFDAVVNMCVEPGKMCMHDMMAIDARGGMGMAGINNTAPMAMGQQRIAVTGICAAPLSGVLARPMSKPGNPAPLTGRGLAQTVPQEDNASHAASRLALNSAPQYSPLSSFALVPQK